MPLFLAGLLLGALSGGGTYALTADGQLSAVVGLIAAVATGCGYALVVLVDD